LLLVRAVNRLSAGSPVGFPNASTGSKNAAAQSEKVSVPSLVMKAKSKLSDWCEVAVKAGEIIALPFVVPIMPLAGSLGILGIPGMRLMSKPDETRPGHAPSVATLLVSVRMKQSVDDPLGEMKGADVAATPPPTPNRLQPEACCHRRQNTWPRLEKA